MDKSHEVGLTPVTPLWGDSAMEALVIQSIEEVEDDELQKIAELVIEDRGIDSVLNLYAKCKVVFKNRPELLEAVQHKQETSEMNERKSNLRALIANISQKLADRRAGIKPAMPKIESTSVSVMADPKAYPKNISTPQNTSTVIPLWDDPAMEALIIQSIEKIEDNDLKEISELIIEDKGIDSVLSLYVKFKTVFEKKPEFLEAIKSKQEAAHMEDRKNNLRALVANIARKLSDRKAGIRSVMPKLSVVGVSADPSTIQPSFERALKPLEMSTVVPLWDDSAMEALIIQSIEQVEDDQLQKISELVVEDRGIDSVLNLHAELKIIFKSRPEFLEVIKKKQEDARMEDRKKNLRALIANIALKLAERKTGGSGSRVFKS